MVMSAEDLKRSKEIAQERGLDVPDIPWEEATPRQLLDSMEVARVLAMEKGER